MVLFRSFAFVVLCCAICSGCGADKTKALTAEVESLKVRITQLEAEKAKVDAQLASANQELQRVAEIKQGYEAARTKFAASLKQMAPLVGNAESPLPPFEGLSDSTWVGKLTPGAEAAPGLKELQNELKGILGDEAKKPAP